jgi:hypothetical protein
MTTVNELVTNPLTNPQTCGMLPLTEHRFYTGAARQREVFFSRRPALSACGSCSTASSPQVKPAYRAILEVCHLRFACTLRVLAHYASRLTFDV